MECKLILPHDQECSGLITQRSLDTNRSIFSCERHFLIFKEIEYLTGCGVDMTTAAEMSQEQRTLLINKIERKGRYTKRGQNGKELNTGTEESKKA